jgi:hypothetical protein
MNFRDRTLELTAIQSLYQCRVETVEPYTLMLAPVYVLMRRNEKLVCVKAPLDFFVPEELESLKRCEVFYLPVTVKEVVRFQTAARIHRSFLEGRNEALPRAGYELSRHIMRATAPLWGAGLCVEPFFASVYADELCGPLPEEALIRGRESAVVRHEEGILLGGALVFVLIQLGWHSHFTLKLLREQVYARTVEGESWEEPRSDWEAVVGDLKKSFSQDGVLSLASMSRIEAEWARKLMARVKKIGEGFVAGKYESLSLSRTGGFFDEAA